MRRKLTLVEAPIWASDNENPEGSADALEEYVVSLVTNKTRVAMEMASQRRQKVADVASTMRIWGQGSRYFAPESGFAKIPRIVLDRELWTGMEAYGPLADLDTGERGRARERLISVLTLYGLQTMYRSSS
jgi:hypothetical protein